MCRPGTLLPAAAPMFAIRLAVIATTLFPLTAAVFNARAQARAERIYLIHGIVPGCVLPVGDAPLRLMGRGMEWGIVEHACRPDGANETLDVSDACCGSAL